MHSSPCLLIAVLLVGLSDFQTSAFAPTFRHHQQQHHQHLLLRPVAAVTTRRHHGQQPRPRCGILNAAASDEDPDVIQIESLASEQIAELIEVTFINACMVRHVSVTTGFWPTIDRFMKLFSHKFLSSVTCHNSNSLRDMSMC
jgi:hypothetical protein